MDFRHLESFAAVAKTRSFSKAAELLFLTQPTISNHISNLETQMNTILINRSSKKVTLTSAGELLLKHVLIILNEKDKALFDLELYRGEITGNLDIASSSTPERYLLTDLICSFSLQYPSVTFNLMRLDSKQVLDKLISGEIDFGIVGSKLEGRTPLIFNEIHTDEVILIGPTQGPYSKLKSLNIENFHQYRFILRENGSGTRSALENALKLHNLSTNTLPTIAIIENTETIKGAVSKGLGLSFISATAVKTELANGTLKQIATPQLQIARSFYFVYHKHMLLSPLSERFQEFILSDKQ